MLNDSWDTETGVQHSLSQPGTTEAESKLVGEELGDNDWRSIGHIYKDNIAFLLEFAPPSNPLLVPSS